MPGAYSPACPALRRPRLPPCKPEQLGPQRKSARLRDKPPPPAGAEGGGAEGEAEESEAEEPIEYDDSSVLRYACDGEGAGAGDGDGRRLIGFTRLDEGG